MDINNPWLVQIIGGIIGGLFVGLIMQLIAKNAKKKKKEKHETNYVIRAIEILGYIFMAPFFILAFFLAIPLFAASYMGERGGGCRFTPTCNHYLIEAIKVHGLLGGSVLGLSRILRCNPWSKGGYDPVPPPLRLRNVEPPKSG